MASADDSDIPNTGAVFTFGKSHFADNLPSKFWVKNDKVLQIRCGDEHTALIAASGRIFMFGSNNWGQLGLGGSVKNVNKPSCIKSLKSEKAKLVACGRYHSIIATESGKLFSFGANGEGQLGVEDITDSNIPIHISSLKTTQYSMLGAGADHSVALTEDGRVFVWGGGGEGQLGLDHETEVYIPKELVFDENVVCIACGYYHTAVVTESGNLYTFGETEGGKLGLGDNPAEYATPQHVSSIPEKVKSVACGGSNTIALTESGKVYSFGEGVNGQLGHGTLVSQSSVPVLMKLDFKVSQVACGENITAIVSERGQLFTFGDGRHGKLALGQESFSNQYKPCKVDRFSRFSVEKVACGGCHMIVTAHKRIENGEVESEEETETSQVLGQSLKSLDLNGSVSARIRRRQTMPAAPMPLNRTLPALGNNRTLPALNGHASLPALKNEENMLHKTMPGIKFSEKKLIESDGDHKEKEKKVTPRPVPRAMPKPLRPEPKESESEDEGVAGSGEDGDVEDEGNMNEEQVTSKEKEDKWSDEEESDEEEVSEDGKKNEEPRSLPGPKPLPRKQKEEKKEEDEEDDDDDKKKKDKKKKDKKGVNLFGKKGPDVSEDEEEEEDDEEEEDEEEEKDKGKKKDKDKKDKDKKKGKDKKKDKDKKDKDKKKDKKKEKKDEEEEEEEEEDDEEETKKKSTKDKKKDKDKKDKKEKKKKKDEKKETEDEEHEEEDEEEAGSKSETKPEEKKEEAPPKPPKKRSRFCTIL